MTTTFTRHWSPEGETVTVDKFEDEDFISPEFLGDCGGPLASVTTRITMTVSNGRATYAVVGWDADRRALKIRKIAELGQVTQSATADSPSGHA